MKKNLAVIFTAMLMLLPAAGSAESGICVELNGENIVFDTEPFVEFERTLVPIRAITEAMDCDVDWDDDKKTAVITNAEGSVFFRADDSRMKKEDALSGESTYVFLDVPVRIRDSRTYVPLRAITEAFGAKVDWDGDKRLVTIEYDIPVIAEFEDEAIEYAVRSNLGSYNYDREGIYTGDITNHMLEKILTVDAGTNDLPEDLKVNSLRDIKLMPNLCRLNLEGQNEIEDLSIIADKKQWDGLNLGGIRTDDDSFLKEIEVTVDITFPNIDLNSNKYIIEWDEARENYYAILKKVKELDKTVESVRSDYEKFKILHDYLVENVTYDYEYSYLGGSVMEDSLYKTLYAGKGVCEDYANTYNRLCRRYGLECWTVSGDAKGIVYEGDEPSWGMGHAWNIVRLDGEYYHVDVTWDDPFGSGGNVFYGYFLKADSVLSQDHRWGGEYGDDMYDITETNYEKRNVPIPVCPYDYED